MATCTGDQYVENIERTECIGNSLVKINNNFKNLDVAVCETGNDIEGLLTLINQLSAAIGNSGSLVSPSVPVGTISAFVGITAPTGWLMASGQAIDISTYQDLSNVLYVGNPTNNTAAFGYRCTSQATPNTTRSTSGPFIVLPDLRDYFIRGLGGANSATYGSIQADEFKSHDHPASSSQAGGHNHTYNNTISNYDIRQGTGGTWPNVRGTLDSNGQTSSVGNHTHAITVNSAGGTETRPKNIPLLYCIKH